MGKEFAITLHVEVEDAARVWNAAWEACRHMSREDFEELVGKIDNPDLGNCLRLIIDPGEGDGFSIHDSTAEASD